MFNVISLTDFIRDELERELEKTTFRWKSSDSTDPDEYGENKPCVYAYTYEDEDITSDGFPTHTPSVLVQPISENGGAWHFVVFCCCVHPAISDIEKTVPVEGKQGIYKHIDSPEYDALGCKRELFKATLLLTEQVALTLKRIGNNNADIKNVVTSCPSPLLPDFPYCSGTVEFDARLAQTTAKINTKLASLL